MESSEILIVVLGKRPVLFGAATKPELNDLFHDTFTSKVKFWYPTDVDLVKVTNPFSFLLLASC